MVMPSTKTNVVSFTPRRESREQVLERLLRDHGSALRRFLCVRLGAVTTVDAEDIEHDVFVRLARIEDLADRLPPDGSSNRSFIIKVANNLILDLERQNKIRSDYLSTNTTQLQESEVNQVTPDATVQAERELEQARHVLMAMRPRWREAFILNRFGNKSYSEIAQLMGVSSKQIEKYIGQAVKRLREAAPKIRGGQ